MRELVDVERGEGGARGVEGGRKAGERRSRGGAGRACCWRAWGAHSRKALVLTGEPEHEGQSGPAVLAGVVDRKSVV